MRRPIYPRNLKLRRQLITHLIDAGDSIFSIKLRIGYAFTKPERKRIEQGVLSRSEKRLLADDHWRKSHVETLIENMRTEGRQN